MTEPLSTTQRHIMESLQYLGAGLSFFCCSASIIKLWKRVFSGSAIRPSRYLDKLVLVLLILDFFESIIMASAPMSMRFPASCKVVAFVRVLNETILIEWNCVIALYSVLSLRRQIEKLERYFYATIVVSFCVGVGVASYMYYKDHLGPAIIMCWIRQENKMLQFYFFYIPLVIVWVFMISVSLRVYRVVSKAPRAFHGRLRDPIMRLREQAIFLTACFLIVWSIPLTTRIIIVIPGAIAPPWLILCHAFSITLLGFLDSIAYDQTRSLFLSCFYKKSSSLPLSPDSKIRQSRGKLQPPSSEAVKTIQSGNLRIFASTFNVGSTGTELLDDLDIWIPRGDLYDVYAIAVQECLIPDQLSEAIHFFLGPSSYTCYTESLGSGTTSLGFHGFIQLMIFVRTSLIKAKACLRIASTPRQVYKGRDLIIAKAPNKGAVAISLFLVDTTICFICCHLSADSHERSGLSRRVRQAREILDEVGNLETGFDAHLVHDHCVVLGDMNFRVAQADARQVLNLIADGASFEESLDGRNSWMQERYEALLDGYYIGRAQASLTDSWTEEELKETSSLSHSVITNSDYVGSAVPTGYPRNPYFGSLIQRDELTQLRKRGDIFCGFHEMDIRFPPTYRLKKLPPLSTTESLTRHFKDPVDPLTEGPRLWRRRSLAFTNKRELEDIYTVKVWNSKTSTSITRIPSYTDRVLYYSNPDKAELLFGEKYEACPTLTLSDHLPVSLSLVLRVTPPILSELPFYFHPQESPQAGLVSFTIVDIDCFLLTARRYDLATSTGSIGSDESLNPPSLHQSFSDNLVGQQLASADGEEIPPKPPVIPRRAISGTYPRDGSHYNSSISKQGGSETLPTIHSVIALFFVSNESVLTAIERNKILRLASALNIHLSDNSKSSTGFAKVLWRHARTHGVKVKSILIGKALIHNIHVLIRLVDPVGRDIGQGVLNLTPDGKLVASTSAGKSTEEKARQDDYSSTSKQAETADLASSSVSPGKASILLTSGGLRTGYFDCKIKDFRVIMTSEEEEYES